MRKLLLLSPLVFTLGAFAQGAPAAPAHSDVEPVGYTDTPIIVGQPWKVHDITRPHPPLVTPSNTPGGPPSDAIVLFNGKDLSQWQTITKGVSAAPTWKVQDGYVEVTPGAGQLTTKEKFGDMQLHVEWASPTEIVSNSQGRGNSGIVIQGLYEIQVMDDWNNPTYADGQAASIYGQWPPLVNPGRKPGEWNTYDIYFQAPRMDGYKVLLPANVTVVYNGLLVQNHMDFAGPTKWRQLAHYAPQPTEDSITLQNHRNMVRYRNIWVRRIAPRDLPEEK